MNTAFVMCAVIAVVSAYFAGRTYYGALHVLSLRRSRDVDSTGSALNMSAPPEPTPSRRHLYLGILALSGFVTSFGAHVVAVNLPDYAEKVGLGALMIGLLIAVYDPSPPPAEAR